MKPYYRIIVFVLMAALMLCAAGCAAQQNASPQQGAEPQTQHEPPTEGEEQQQPQNERAETPELVDDAAAAPPIEYPTPFEPGYFTALNQPLVVAQCMGVTFSADERAEFVAPYDCNIDRTVLAQNGGERSVILTWQVWSETQGLSPDAIMSHPQPAMLILEPGESMVLRSCWQYSPTDVTAEDATFNYEIGVIDRDTHNRETVRFDLYNHVTVTPHSDPQPGNATVSGRIVSAATGEPLSGLPLEFSDANFRYIANTDQNGEYEVSLFAYKNARGYYMEYAMLVNAEASNAQIHMRQGNNDEFADYAQARRAFSLQPGDALTIDIALPERAEQLDYSLTSVMDVGVQTYAFDATADGSVIATVPFHSGKPDEEREKTAYLHVFDYTGELLFKKHIVDETPAVDVSRDGSLIATTMEERVSDRHTRAVVYDRRGEVFYMPEMKEYESPLVGRDTPQIWVVQISDDNRLFAYADTAGMVWVDDMESGERLWSAFCGGQVRKLGFDREDSVLYVSAGDGYLRCFSTSDGALIWETYVDAWITVWTITEHYITAMTKASPCAVQVVDKLSGETVLSIPVATGGSEAAMSPDESLIWYGNGFSGGKAALSNNIYDINGKMLYSMIQPGMTAAFTADSELFAVQNPKTIAVVNREGQILWQHDFSPDIHHPNSWANATVLWISADGKHIVSGASGDLSAPNLGQIFFFSRN